MWLEWHIALYFVIYLVYLSTLLQCEIILFHSVFSFFDTKLFDIVVAVRH